MTPLVEYFREFKAIWKKALTRESGVQEGEKTRGQKACDTVPLREHVPKKQRFLQQ
jgi:hypothetical protein